MASRQPSAETAMLTTPAACGCCTVVTGWPVAGSQKTSSEACGPASAVISRDLSGVACTLEMALQWPCMEMTDFCSFACTQAQSSLGGTAASTEFVAAVVCMRQGPATLCSLNTSAGLPDSQLPAGRSDCRNFYHRSQLCGLQQLPHGHSGRLRGWRCCLAHLICHIPTVRSAYHITRLSGGFHVFRMLLLLLLGMYSPAPACHPPSRCYCCRVQHLTLCHNCGAELSCTASCVVVGEVFDLDTRK